VSMLPDYLTNPPPLLLFGGKGGVGKTTTAAAAALRLARDFPRRAVRVVSTDPAHSLADAFAGDAPPENLEVLELDADSEHKAFVALHRDAIKAIADRGTFLDADEVDNFLELSLPGIDELVAFLRLAEWVAADTEKPEDERTIHVVDTAPTGHTLRLLAMPAFAEDWLGALDALMGKHRFMMEAFGGASASTDPAEAFIELIEQQIESLSEVLSDSDLCRFVPVSLAEQMALAETADLLGSLDELDIAAPELILNRVVPAEQAEALAGDAARQHRAWSELDGDLRLRLIGRTAYAAPLLADEPRGTEHLLAVPDSYTDVDLWLKALGRSSRVDSGLPNVAGALSLPKRDPLVIVAGKGGVGKTTVSCAIAAALGARVGNATVLSTDPAGSLADCFGVEIGSEPTKVATGCDAIQLDAETAFDELRDEFRDEIERFFEEALGGVSLAFEGDAMARLIDLSPPGLDEVMALAALDDIASHAGHATVLDTAPTGHLLRLLQMPGLVEDWLARIFDVILRHRREVKLPKVEQRLTELSRGVKRLRATFADHDSACVVPVAIPTRLALEETRDLVRSCDEMQLRVPSIVVNQCTPEDAPGALAAALRTREASVLAEFRGSFGSIGVVAIERRGDPRGAATLAGIGSALLSGIEVERSKVA
jgi:arsenite-transporting ATPase